MFEGSSIKVLGISGSLRRGSFNTATLRAAQELVPPGVTIELFDLSFISLYNEDMREKGFPPSVESLRQKIKASDALLIVTPEYNYSIPGVLKNAIDWASRPPDQPFDGKPIALLGASPSMLGTARAQYHLRQCFVYLNGLVLNRPEVFINNAPEKFNREGKLIDLKSREMLQKLLVALKAWAVLNQCLAAEPQQVKQGDSKRGGREILHRA